MRISDWSSDVCSSDLRPKASDAASRLAVAKRIGDVMSGQLRVCVGCRPCAGNGGMRGLESEDVEKFDIEDQRRVRLDRRISLFAVGQHTGISEQDRKRGEWGMRG